MSTAPGAYPRVLFVTPCAFNWTTGGGVTFSNLFLGWPKDRLATVHNDPTPTSDEVCDRYFRLGPDEIRRWGPLEWMAARTSAPAVSAGSEAAAPSGPALRGLKQRVFGSGVPESVRISPALAKFLAEFQPQLIYTILGGQGIVDLTDEIREQLHLPVVVHVMDDWRDTVYGDGWLSGWQRRRLNRKIAALVRVAAARMGICAEMCERLSQDYGVPFAAFQNGVDVGRWLPLARTDLAPARPARVVYAGALLPFAQADAVVDAAQAISRLAAEGMAVGLDIHAPAGHAQAYRDRLACGPAVRLLPQFDRWEDYFRAIVSADVLLLPVNFDPTTMQYIRYSMPTKVPEYMLSGTPILVYGPAGVAQVDYARREGWGEVVATCGVQPLAEGIRRLAFDLPLRKRLASRAHALATERHDLHKVRAGFQAALAGAVS
jgi:glycosyltransferase involved in cell wall biosynthesis